MTGLVPIDSYDCAGRMTGPVPIASYDSAGRMTGLVPIDSYDCAGQMTGPVPIDSYDCAGRTLAGGLIGNILARLTRDRFRQLDHMGPTDVTRKLPIMRPVNALTVLGTDFGVGKTVLMCGLAAALREQGFPMRAMKPIILGARKSADSELSFIGSITRTPLTYHMQCLDSPSALNEQSWLTTVSAMRASDETTLIELPGGASTPVSYDEIGGQGVSIVWRDSAELARELDFPCLLVARHASDAFEKLVVTTSYLLHHKLRLLGLVTVETQQGLGQEIEAKFHRSDFAMAIVNRTQIPYLGCIKYSPSVSVDHVHQGNLIKLTTNGLDLLGVLKSMNLKVSA